MDYTSHHSKLSPLLKQLTKKDVKTQIKAANDIFDLIKVDEEALYETSRLWVFIFKTTAMQQLQLRKVVIVINDYLFKTLKKEMATVIKDMFGLWLLNIADVPLALESLSIFPNISKVLDFTKDSVPSFLILYLNDEQWTGNASVAINYIFKTNSEYFDEYLPFIESNIYKYNNVNHYTLLLHMLKLNKLKDLDKLLIKCTSDYSGLSNKDYWALVEHQSLDNNLKASKTLPSFLSNLLNLPDFKLSPIHDQLESFLTHLISLSIPNVLSALQASLSPSKLVVIRLFCHFQSLPEIIILLQNTSVSEGTRYQVLKIVYSKLDLSILSYFDEFKNNALILFSTTTEIPTNDLALLLNANDTRFLDMSINDQQALQLIKLISNFQISLKLILKLIKSQAHLESVCNVFILNNIAVFPALLDLNYNFDFLVKHENTISSLAIHDLIPFYTVNSLLPHLPPFPLSTDHILSLFYHSAKLSDYFKTRPVESVSLVIHLLNDHEFHDVLSFLPSHIIHLISLKLTDLAIIKKSAQCLPISILNEFIYNSDSLLNTCTRYSYHIMDPIDAYLLNKSFNSSFVPTLQEFDNLKFNLPLQESLYKHITDDPIKLNLLKLNPILMFLQNCKSVHCTALLKEMTTSSPYILFIIAILHNNKQLFAANQQAQHYLKGELINGPIGDALSNIPSNDGTCYYTLLQHSKSLQMDTADAQFIEILQNLPDIFSPKLQEILLNKINLISDIEQYASLCTKLTNKTWQYVFLSLLNKCFKIEMQYLDIHKQRRPDEDLELGIYCRIVSQFDILHKWLILFDGLKMTSNATKDDILQMMQIEDKLSKLMILIIDKLHIKSPRLVDLSKLKNSSSYLTLKGNLYLILFMGLMQYFSDFTRSYMVNAQLSRNLIRLLDYTFMKDVVKQQIDDLQNKFEFQNVFLKILRNSQGIDCRVYYEVDELKLEAAFIVPHHYPLQPINIMAIERIGITEHLFKSWLLASRLLISNKNGTLYDGIELFSKNVISHFSGQTECVICYSIIGVLDKTLPTKKCLTCLNKFHGGCLQRWFKESKQTNCPLCRSLFRF